MLKIKTGRCSLAAVHICITFVFFSCAHQSANNKLQKKHKLISDTPVSTIYSVAASEEQAQAVIDKLLDEDEVNSQEAQPLDSNNTVATEDVIYNEQDQAEDIIGKLLEDKDESTPKVVEPTKTFVEIKNHPLVNKWITYFTKTDRERFIRFMTNGAKYRSAIEKIFDEEGVPRDLFFVGMIESGFFLKAQSHANAVGPWQFIRATGKRYGLIVSKTLDERKDLFKATHAAARYFRDLYKIFGSWELAMGAYNAGEYGIMRRIKKAKTENFFSLASRGYLPIETANYVPKVMAVLHIYQNLEKYGFNKIVEENPFDQTVLVKLKHSHSLRLIANTLDMNLETLQFLNSELPTPYTPYLKTGHYQLRVPKQAWQRFGNELVAVLRKSTSITPSYTLARYERDSLKSWKTRKIFQGKKSLKFTSANVRKDKLIRTNQPLIYTVQNGDNLSTIAKRFKVGTTQLSKFNKLSRNQLAKGQKIKIPGTLRTYYKVKRGDNLYSIAKRFNLSPNFLKQLNDLSAGDIYAGQKLLVLL